MELVHADGDNNAPECLVMLSSSLNSRTLRGKGGGGTIPAARQVYWFLRIFLQPSGISMWPHLGLNLWFRNHCQTGA